MRFRKRPVVIEAFQLPPRGDFNVDGFLTWAKEHGLRDYESGRDETLVIQTLEGEMTAQPGDWIVKGVAGEFYPCKARIFAATYEPASITDDFAVPEMTCEAHPGTPWPHGDCAGPGMPWSALAGQVDYIDRMQQRVLEVLAEAEEVARAEGVLLGAEIASAGVRGLFDGLAIREPRGPAS